MVYICVTSIRFIDFYILALILDFMINKYDTDEKRYKLQHFYLFYFSYVSKDREP